MTSPSRCRTRNHRRSPTPSSSGPRQARDTVRSATPSAHDLHALAADLARLATHSRAIVRAAVHAQLIPVDQGERIDQALAASAAGWLETAAAWTGFHTAQPPTPSKIAASHALGQALMAVTRDGRDWADPLIVAARVDLVDALAAVRRGMDLARDVADRLDGLPARLASSGHLFAPAALLAPSVGLLHTRPRPPLVPAAAGDVADLASSIRRQVDPARAAAELLRSTGQARPPSPDRYRPAATTTPTRPRISASTDSVAPVVSSPAAMPTAQTIPRTGGATAQ